MIHLHPSLLSTAYFLKIFLILLSYLTIFHVSGRFKKGFLTKILYAFYISPILATYLAYSSFKVFTVT